MLNKVRNSSIIVMGIILVVLSFYCVVEAEDSNAVERFVKIQCDADQVAEATGNDSILSSYYKSYECHKVSGNTKSQAKENARNDILQREANYWYAKKCGLLLSKDELEKQYKQFLDDIKGAEEYNEIQKYYKENGRTIEKDILENQKYYETQFVINKLYLHYREKFDNGEMVLNGKKYTEWDSYWNAVQNNALNEFKKRKDYTDLKNGLDASEKIIDNEQLKDKIINEGRRCRIRNEKRTVSKTSIYKDLSYSHKEIEVTK